MATIIVGMVCLAAGWFAHRYFGSVAVLEADAKKLFTKTPPAPPAA